MPRIWKYTLALLAAGVILIFIAAFSLTDTRLHLVFCDVGQGDAILVYRGSTQILVDGGPDNSVLSCLSRHMPFWDRKIELVILSHADLDHYGGLVDVIRRYQIGAFAGSGVGKDLPAGRQGDVGFETLQAEIEEKKIQVMSLGEGSRIKAEQLAFTTLWPLESRVLGASTVSGNTNEYSVVLHLRYGEFDALLTGDIQPPVTDIVADSTSEVCRRRNTTSEVLGSCIEVLKVPHHGSKNGLTEMLLEATKPKLAVISVGKDNRYGHPHKEIINLLDGYMVKRTDLDGEVEVVTDGVKWWYNQ